MSKKNKKKKNSGPPQALIRLSQCMIVKNEEKNIEKALSWGRKVACEQIIVDTGSTDRTIEIAERMGAKVFHFEWIDNFAAAKNYAIEQASGNWIAFLDADEYFTDTDAEKLIIFLKRIQKDPEMRQNYLALNTSLANIDTEGNTVSVIDQERIFRNLPNIRYKWRIHEQLDISVDNIVMVDEIQIKHTGYTDEALIETGKLERNARLLREELKTTPNDITLKAYLADSLKRSENENDREEADKLFTEVMTSEEAIIPDLLRKAYIHFMKKAMQANDTPKCISLCEQAMRAIPGDEELKKIYNDLVGK